MKDFFKQWNIILGSGSPRRAELLRGMGLNFEVFPVEADETVPEGLSSDKVAIYLAELKADAVPVDRMNDHTLLITADTIVVKDGLIMGKPFDRHEAIAMLSSLSNAPHEVITGMHLRSLTKRKSFSVHSSVWFKSLREEEITYYVDQYQPFDKAGAYGIQEWIGFIGINRIVGSYFNVVGLPTSRLYDELRIF